VGEEVLLGILCTKPSHDSWSFSIDLPSSHPFISSIHLPTPLINLIPDFWLPLQLNFSQNLQPISFIIASKKWDPHLPVSKWQTDRRTDRQTDRDGRRVSPFCVDSYGPRRLFISRGIRPLDTSTSTRLGIWRSPRGEIYWGDNLCCQQLCCGGQCVCKPSDHSSQMVFRRTSSSEGTIGYGYSIISLPNYYSIDGFSLTCIILQIVLYCLTRTKI
jgi:hypothetical protein